MVRHTGEDLVNEERVTATLMPPLQALGVFGSELDTPEADRFVTDYDTSLREKILNIAVAVTTRLRLNR